METQYRTEQEGFWAGAFGDEYMARNTGDQLVASNTALLARALARAGGISSCIEFGANIGMNLRALRLLFPRMELVAVEINAAAASELKRRLPDADVAVQSLFDFEPTRQYDLVLSKGVLIHLDPGRLPRAYDVLHDAVGRYLLLCEYYNPVPVAIEYRGHTNRLFKRDFAGEMLDRYADLRLVDYGFAYRRDPNFALDDVSWFLMERRA